MANYSPNLPFGDGLIFRGLFDHGVWRGFDVLHYLADKTSQVFLCIGHEENRVLISGTTYLSRQAQILDAIDQFGVWGRQIPIWMVSEKNGVLTARTPSIYYLTHVKPFYNNLTISGMKADQPKLIYPGSGKGRLLSKRINNRYYFIYAFKNKNEYEYKNNVKIEMISKFETSNLMRGFDCTSFPMVLLSIPRLEGDGYGSDLCKACNAVPCGLEQIKTTDLEEKFRKRKIPHGFYVVFSEGHVLLYDANVNILHEFNKTDEFNGFRSIPAAARSMYAPRNLWWVRKLDDEKYRPQFQ